jgi:Uma2 family endonuclease
MFYEEDESDDTVVQPDIMVVYDKKKIGPEDLRGASDLVIEILFPSNTAIEMERKLDLYREAGVREYWVVDPKNKRLKVYPFEENANFYRIYGSADTVPVTILPELRITLEEVFAESEEIPEN